MARGNYGEESSELVGGRPLDGKRAKGDKGKYGLPISRLLSC